MPQILLTTYYNGGTIPIRFALRELSYLPILAAGLPQIITVEDPLMIVSGGPTQTQLSPITAAGSLPIRTVAAPGPTIGPPTWGIGDGQAGVCIGHVCISVNLAAGGIFITF